MLYIWWEPEILIGNTINSNLLSVDIELCCVGVYIWMGILYSWFDYVCDCHILSSHGICFLIDVVIMCVDNVYYWMDCVIFLIVYLMFVIGL